MANLIKMMEAAQSIQNHWNYGTSKERRSAMMFRKNAWMQRIFHKAAIETECRKCLKRMDTSTTPIFCEFCGGETWSPYYC